MDDSLWNRVSLPHTWNDVDTYRALISHSSGDRSGQYLGIGWYRKRFKIPANAKGGKVFLEFEGLKQAGRFYLNGKLVGKHENGVTAAGLDITEFARFGMEENVLAVKVDNSSDYREEATGTPFQWMGRGMNPSYGGLNRNAWLHLTGKTYQTLPLYENLQTSGIYITGTEFDIAAKKARLSVEAQIRNETAAETSLVLSTVVVDADGQVLTRWKGEPKKVPSGGTETLTISEVVEKLRFWSVEDPYLYSVYSILSAGDRVLDVCRTVTGFRKTEFKGGVGTGGVWLNDRFVYLQGFAQRSTNDWAGLGQAYPDWMHDLTAGLIRGCHSNYIRWMHIAPQRSDVLACDRSGILQMAPAGDQERDVSGRQWTQRREVMQATMIYFRNNPSVLLWEAGNSAISHPHLREMVELRKRWDPSGGRAMGCRSLHDPAAIALTEYFGIMVGQDPRVDKIVGYTTTFRGYSAERRDRMPLIETEDFRDEGARRFWDDYSPPHFGFKPGPNDTYRWNSESFALAAAERYHAYEQNKISNSDPARSKWAGYASIYFSDSNADGRQESSEVCRVSGKVDSVRLPKEIYHLHRVMQNPVSDLHIFGHWTYPPGTKKTVHIAAGRCDSVELLLNERSVGRVKSPISGYIFSFPDVVFAPGTLRAIARKGDRVVASGDLVSAGEPKSLKLSAIKGPRGWKADGADILLLDVEVVDAHGRRCPTDEARVDFAVQGPAVWRGGVNSGKIDSTNNLYLNTECGINRVAVRSQLTAGPVRITASRTGLSPASVQISTESVRLIGGLSPFQP